MEKKKMMSRGRKVFLIICGVILAMAIVGALWYLTEAIQADQVYKQAAEDYLKGAENIQEVNGEGEDNDAGGSADSLPGSGSGSGEFSVDWQSLWAVNPDVCAWIQIPAIPTINYPVIHYMDNDYYLRRSWTGQPLTAGCIMEDWHCSPDFTDFHTIVYGHNMTTGSMAGSMFGQLKKFQEESFYESNDDRVIIYTPEATLTYTIFSVHVVVPDDPAVYLVGDFTRGQAFNFVEGLKNASEYDTGVQADGDDKILTLSTCSGLTSSRRLVLHSKLTRAMDPEGNVITGTFGRTENAAEA